jgi:hypothetical protein
VCISILLQILQNRHLCITPSTYNNKAIRFPLQFTLYHKSEMYSRVFQAIHIEFLSFS